MVMTISSGSTLKNCTNYKQTWDYIWVSFKVNIKRLCNKCFAIMSKYAYVNSIKFQDCFATITFTQIFNDLFDIFNLKNQKQHNFKKPISTENYCEISKYKCAQYIKSLFLVEKSQSILNSKIKTGFLGFFINIQSMLSMYKFLCVDNELLKYIPMYKISQDHLELILSSIQSLMVGIIIIQQLNNLSLL